MQDGPAWLKSMEHGALGEARARAFLMERFWVLSRSVDVEGADYLIQRRLTAATFLDKEPPRLGVVQVKFIQDGATYLRIPKPYLAAKDGQPYGEFFLLVFTGHEDDQKIFLLSAAEVLKDFEEKDVDGKTVLVLKGSGLLSNNNYRIRRQTTGLDKIDAALRTASLAANRTFLFQTGHVEIQREHIGHDWSLPIENDWGDIEKEFFAAKKAMRHTMFELEEAAEAISKILRSTDPAEAIALFKDTLGGIHDPRSYSPSLSFPCVGFDEDFQTTVTQHRGKLDGLRKLKIESSYFALLEEFDRKLEDGLRRVLSTGAQALRITVTYNAEDLANPSFVFSGTSPSDKRVRVCENYPGCQVLEFDLQKLLSQEVRNPDAPASILAEALRQNGHEYRRLFVGAVDRAYLGPDFTAFWVDDEDFD